MNTFEQNKTTNYKSVNPAKKNYEHFFKYGSIALFYFSFWNKNTKFP